MLLLWPRFLVLIGYLTMLFLYAVLARWEETQCLAQYGESYRRYLERTGRFLPLVMSAATEDPRVQRELEPVEHAKRIVYVVPEAWSLADLPLDVRAEASGHHTPQDFDRRHYKLLFTRARAHRDASGAAILKTAYGLDPILRVSVDIAAAEVTAIESPPRYVIWGDVPTPLF